MKKTENPDITVTTAKSLNLTCYVGGNPRPAVVWYHQADEKSKLEIVDARMYNNSEGMLQIPNVGSEHQGIYTCNATNKLGSGFLEYSLKLGECSNKQNTLKALFYIVEDRF